MNILPKKRWHVRTKENIARVRKDEAEAAEKERQENLRIENADREARLTVLKNKSKQKLFEAGVPAAPSTESLASPTSEHINLFADYDSALKNTNKEHDYEIKEKKEDYEKQIGYLTYLGQDTNESNKKKNWYEVAPESSRFTRTDEIKETYTKLVLKDEDGKQKSDKLDIKNGEIGWKSKQRIDPIHSFQKYCHGKANKDASKEKSHRRKSDEKCKDDDRKTKLQKLREARLKREREEKYKTELFLTKLNGTGNDTTLANEEPKTIRVKPKYNSQFNPELARQNYR